MVLGTKKPTSAVPDPRVAQAAAGDRAVAQQLLLELLPRVRNLVRYLVWSDADVDDIAQLSLVEIARSFGNYRGEGALSSWADRITMRVTLHHIRRKRTEERRRSALSPDLRVVSGNDQPDDFTLRREAARLLDELPDDQRQAVVLHHVLGLSMPELAEELGIPFETARSRLRLGIQKLRARVFRRGVP
ncbi:MAG TPA: RNA polymerase sigma factor [Polyangiales bacterium]|nr:RNA polymerase sigma factor [Polyangiales bacterium]